VQERAGAAKEARARHIEHAQAALEAAQRAAREAAKIGAQYDSAHAEADEAKTDENHSADTLAKARKHCFHISSCVLGSRIEGAGLDGCDC
jgi:hypothetical protein